MLLNEISRATLVLGLAALQADPKLNLPKGSIKPLVGDAAWADIENTKATYDSFNTSMQAGILGLSAEAKAYWTEVRKCAEMGKRAQASGSKSAEKRVSVWSEKLAESFSFLVPENEHGAFIEHENDDAGWDEMWSYLEFRPPLLRREFREGIARVNSMNEAQVIVLGSILDYRENEEEMQFARDQLVQFWSDENTKLSKAASSQEKKEAKAKAKAERDAKIAAGDQKLTKGSRNPRKVMGELFDRPVSGGNGLPKQVRKPKGAK